MDPCIRHCRPRYREGEADDAGEPLVEIVLVLRLLGLHDFGRGLAGHEFCPPALGQVAGEFGVPIIRPFPPPLAGEGWEGQSWNCLIWSGVQPCGTPISASGIEPSVK